MNVIHFFYNLVFKNYISQKIINVVRKDISRNIDTQINEKLGSEIKKISDTFKRPMDLVSGHWGYANSTKNLSSDDKMSVYLNFQYNEKLKVALSVASSYSGGDYLEFGSHDLYTLRNFIAAFDVGNLNSRYPETNFYGFDIFGKYNKEEFDNFKLPKGNTQAIKNFFDDFTHQGDLLQHYNNILDEFQIFRDRTHLIQGFFENTIPDFKTPSKIGFVFLDCNILPSYQYVLKYIFDKIDLGTYIYVDEYFDNFVIHGEIEKFKNSLRHRRNLDLIFVRSAASVGALFRLVEKIEENDLGIY